MRAVAVLLALFGAANCNSDSPRDPAPAAEGFAWLDLGPPPQAALHPESLGPVAPSGAPLSTGEEATATGTDAGRVDTPSADKVAPPSPDAIRVARSPESDANMPGAVAHGGVAAGETASGIELPADVVVAAHGPRMVQFAVRGSAQTQATVTSWFLAPEHIPRALRGIDSACVGRKPRTSRARTPNIDLDRAFPFKFGATCLEVKVQGLPVARTVVQSTDLAVTLRYDVDRIEALVTSMEAGSPVSARLTLVAADETVLWTGSTDSAGSATLPGVSKLENGARRARLGPLTLIAGAGEDYVATTLRPSDDSNYLGAYEGLPRPPRIRPAASITTGRRWYRAGEEIWVHGLVRQVAPDEIATPGDGVVNWSATAFDTEILAKGETAPLSHGAFSLRLKLPAGVSPGPLRFRFDVPGAGELGHTVQIAGPDLPFSVDLGGDERQLTVSATAAVEATISVVAVPAQPTARPGWQLGPAEQGTYVPTGHARRAATPTLQRTVRVAPDAPFRAALATPDGKGEWDLRIRVTAGPPGGTPLLLEDVRQVRSEPAVGIVAPAAWPAGPCPGLEAMAFAGPHRKPVSAQLALGGAAVTDCTKPGDYLVHAGPTQRVMRVFDPSVPPSQLTLLPTTDGLVAGRPSSGAWRGMLTLESAGIVRRLRVMADGPWATIPLPDLTRWAPSVTATLSVPRTTNTPGTRIQRRVHIPVPQGPTTTIQATTSAGAVEGMVQVNPVRAYVQILCVDAAAAEPANSVAAFYFPRSDGSLSAREGAASLEGRSPQEPATGQATPPARQAFVADHPLRHHDPVPTTAVSGESVRGALPFRCEMPQGGRVTVLARASNGAQFSDTQAEFTVPATRVPVSPADPPEVGAWLTLPVTGPTALSTSTRDASSLDIVIGNSALVGVAEPVRRLLRGDRRTLRGAIGRVIALAAGKELVVHLGEPDLRTPEEHHAELRTAVRAVLDHQTERGDFGAPAQSVDSTLALVLAQEAGAWVSPRQLDRAVAHLQRFHLVVPESEKDREQLVWRAWFVRKLAGKSEREPSPAPTQTEALFAAARARSANPSLFAHVQRGEDTWSVAASAEYARSVPREAGLVQIWVGERGALSQELLGRRHAITRISVPLTDLRDPAVTVVASTPSWATLSLRR